MCTERKATGYYVLAWFMFATMVIYSSAQVGRAHAICLFQMHTLIPKSFSFDTWHIVFSVFVLAVCFIRLHVAAKNRNKTIVLLQPEQNKTYWQVRI